MTLGNQIQALLRRLLDTEGVEILDRNSTEGEPNETSRESEMCLQQNSEIHKRGDKHIHSSESRICTRITLIMSVLRW